MENLRFLAIHEASTNNIERFIAKSFGYSVNEETGIARIYAQGSLNDLGGWWTFSQGNYSMLRALIENLANDESVKGIVLHLNSPGGYVDGCLRLASTSERQEQSSQFGHMAKAWSVLQLMHWLHLAPSSMHPLPPKSAQLAFSASIWMHQK